MLAIRTTAETFVKTERSRQSKGQLSAVILLKPLYFKSSLNMNLKAVLP